MPRPLRPDVAGGIHHVSTRGNARQAVFRDDADYRTFIESAVELDRRDGFVRRL
jgi:putative transposase